MSALPCSFCRSDLEHTFVELGMAPLVSAYLEAGDLHKMEPFFPLHVYVCGECHLVQLPESQSPDQLFRDYPYFSSYSKSWLEHSRAYVEMMMERFGFGPSSQAVELASNDGYLLKYFQERGVPVLGIEPARNVAEVAQKAGIPTVSEFFGVRTAEKLSAEGTRADLLLGNNVLAHVPDINDFVGGMKVLLKPGGIITMEFPHLMRLMAENQFDTIFHEHFSYLSFHVTERVFAQHGLSLFDAEELPTHGGSLRIYARHADDESKPVGDRVGALKAKEEEAGLTRLETYAAFSRKPQETKRNLLTFLIQVKKEGASIAGYGAPGKGCILLNYCGIGPDFLHYTVDISPHKQGLFMPGVHVPIHHPDRIRETRPDYLLILPWNLKSEIMQQMEFIREWGGKFIVPIPEVQIC
jgi:SAM-dependent methyltransferase